MSPNLFGIVIALIGIFPIAAVLFNWQFFMNNRRARLVTSILGEKGMRVFYIIFGLVLTVFGFLIVTGLIDIPNQ